MNLLVKSAFRIVRHSGTLDNYPFGISHSSGLVVDGQWLLVA